MVLVQTSEPHVLPGQDIMALINYSTKSFTKSLIIFNNIKNTHKSVKVGSSWKCAEEFVIRELVMAI